MNLNVNKNDVMQYFFTVFCFLTTVLIPILNYIIFKNSLVQGIILGDLEQKYEIITILVVIIGIIATVSIYLIYYFPKYSVKRSCLTLSQSIMDITLLIIFSQISLLSVFQDKFGLILDISGVYILLIITFLPFIFKNIFDVFDFKKNEEFYQRKLRAKTTRLLKESNRKIKCKNCSYICRKGWKKCPICNKKL